MSLNLSKTFGLIRPMTRSLLLSTSTLTRFGVNGVEAALALDFIASEYRTANTATTFADAFMGDNPKLTYNPGSASSSQSTMVNSSGEIVWAPHNLLDYSEDFSQWSTTGVVLDSSTVADPLGGITASTFSNFMSATNARLFASTGTSIIGLPQATFSVWLKGTAGETIKIEIDAAATDVTLTGSWQFETVTAQLPTSDIIRVINRSHTADVVSVWGAHVYRSDLGGMAPVPGAEGDFQYYVPTNGSAEYLPRVGHHVFNGSTWVNEGLLIESEPRTNLVTYSEDFTDASWSQTGSTMTSVGTTLAPDGTSVTVYNFGDMALYGDFGTASAVPYTGSIWVKADKNATIGFRVASTVGSDTVDVSVTTEWQRLTHTHLAASSEPIRLLIENRSSQGYHGSGNLQLAFYGAQLEQASTPSSYIPTNNSTVTRGGQSLTVPANWYDADNPTYTGEDLVIEGSHTLMEPGWSYANGVYSYSASTVDLLKFGEIGISGGRIYSVSLDIANRTIGTVGVKLFGGGLNFLSGNGTHTIFLTGATGDGLQISGHSNFDGDVSNISARQVSAPQFGWPEPEYIGPNLVDNAGFDTDTVWTTSAGWTISGGVASFSNPSGTELYQSLSLPAGVYAVTVTASYTGAAPDVYFNSPGITNTVSLNNGTPTTAILVHNGSYSRVTVLAKGNSTVTVDNISVREINPLSVSIQMDGRMTYADDGGALTFTRWSDEVDNSIELFNRFANVNTGGSGALRIRNEDPDNIVNLYSPDDTYSPGILTPFNISSRHGSTFVNGAVDGVALTENTNPTALPDLSGADLEIAQDFMGTIGQFRQFAGDIGDTGLVTATNPSTEPTLSLTFDGTEGSFYNLNWSE